MDLLCYDDETENLLSPKPIENEIYIAALDGPIIDKKRKRNVEREGKKKKKEKNSTHSSSLPNPLSLINTANPNYLVGANFNRTDEQASESLLNVLRPSELSLFNVDKGIGNDVVKDQFEEEEKQTDEDFEVAMEEHKKKKGAGFVVESGAKLIKSVEPEEPPPTVPQKPTRAQKEKKKVKSRGQTGWRTESQSGRWKSEEEMRIRQQFH
jgi:hypothetical protein